MKANEESSSNAPDLTRRDAARFVAKAIRHACRKAECHWTAVLQCHGYCTSHPGDPARATSKPKDPTRTRQARTRGVRAAKKAVATFGTLAVHGVHPPKWLVDLVAMLDRLAEYPDPGPRDGARANTMHHQLVGRLDRIADDLERVALVADGHRLANPTKEAVSEATRFHASLHAWIAFLQRYRRVLEQAAGENNGGCVDPGLADEANFMLRAAIATGDDLQHGMALRGLCHLWCPLHGMLVEMDHRDWARRIRSSPGPLRMLEDAVQSLHHAARLDHGALACAPSIEQPEAAALDPGEWAPPAGYIGAKAIKAKHGVNRSTLWDWEQKHQTSVAIDPRSDERHFPETWVEERVRVWKRRKPGSAADRN